jgi:hypothetical protein
MQRRIDAVRSPTLFHVSVYGLVFTNTALRFAVFMQSQELSFHIITRYVRNSQPKGPFCRQMQRIYLLWFV